MTRRYWGREVPLLSPEIPRLQHYSNPPPNKKGIQFSKYIILIYLRNWMPLFMGQLYILFIFL